MAEEQKKIRPESGEVFYEWAIPEFTEHERGFYWYVIMIVAAIAFIIYSIFTVNYLFAIIIILAVYIVFLRSYSPRKKVTFKIAREGIIIGQEFIPYNRVRNFYIIYKPPFVKKLFFDLKGLIPDIAIPLENKNPLIIRKKLLEYLDEDVNKETQSLTEQLDNLLKL